MSKIQTVTLAYVFTIFFNHELGHYIYRLLTGNIKNSTTKKVLYYKKLQLDLIKKPKDS